uniref:Uncharacterized protein n=1 Tax=Eutreptiella gymnastica TaxID=73025 RepID=A0A7S4G5E2_9EUGL
MGCVAQQVALVLYCFYDGFPRHTITTACLRFNVCQGSTGRQCVSAILEWCAWRQQAARDLQLKPAMPAVQFRTVPPTLPTWQRSSSHFATAPPFDAGFQPLVIL